MTRTQTASRFLVVALALAVAGCGTGRTNTDSNLRADLQLNPAALSSSQTIVENAMTQPQLSSLVAAIQRADLAGALSADGPFTVFAPINAAFEGMDLADIDPDDLAEVLKYHVVEGDYRLSELTDGMTLPTLSGERLDIQRLAAGDPMSMVDDADIIYPDIESSNGRIHLINLVLDPTRGSGAQ